MIKLIFMRYIIIVCFIILSAIPLSAQETDGNDLKIKIALYGNGDILFSWWGHTSLIIEEESADINSSYDFGIFSFRNNNFYQNFIFGRFLFSTVKRNAQNNINRYIRQNRDVTIFTLDLPPEKREEIRQLAEFSILPENRYYYYNFFYDNCSTRIRDIIDIATEGQFKLQFSNEKYHYTLRQQARLHTWVSPITDWFLCFLMGKENDQPITFWEAMFLPSELANSINNFNYTGENGVTRKLVSDTEIIYKSQGRYAVLDVPEKLWPYGLIAGITIAFILFLLFFMQEKHPAIGQVVSGITYSLFGLLTGVIGLILFFSGFFTDHEFTHYNINLLFYNPLILVSVPFGIKYAIAKDYSRRILSEFVLRFLWFLVVLGIIVSVILKLFPGFWQDNFHHQIILLPVALIFSLEPFGLKKLARQIKMRFDKKNA